MFTTQHVLRRAAPATLALIAWMTALPSSAQQFVYSPPQYANVEAPGPAADVTGFPSYRVQHVYDSSVFTGLGPGTFTITRIDWRADGSVDQPLVYSSERWIATMSTTAVTPRTLSRTYAANIGADVQTVVDGPVTLTTQSRGPVGGPKEFDTLCLRPQSGKPAV
jgi:hypothetical protein